MNWAIRKSPAPIGIDVGGRCVKAVQFNHSSAGWRIEATASMPRGEVGSDIQRPEVRRLCDMLNKGPFKGRQVVLAVPGDKLITGIMGLPPRDSGAPIERIARLELSRMHGHDPDTFEMACWDLPAPARAGESTYVMAAACPHADADALLDVFKAEGLVVKGLDIHAAAVTRACGPLLEDVSGVAAILDLGWCLERLVMLYQGVVVYERHRGKGGIGSLVAALAEQLDLEGERAEQLLMACGLEPPKVGEGSDPALAEKIRSAAVSHFDAMIEEMRMPLSYVSNQYHDAAMERLLLIGGGSEVPGLPAYLASKVQFEVRSVALEEIAECSRELEELHGPALAVAAGLARFEEG